MDTAFQKLEGLLDVIEGLIEKLVGPLLPFLLILLPFILGWSFWPLWLPLILGKLFFVVWDNYKREHFVFEKMGPENYVLLELHLPKNIFRSPQGMEFVIDILWDISGGAMGWQNRFLYGAVLKTNSLEIISVEGNVYFFIRVQKNLAHLVKNTLYSQYPNVEINEVDDYTAYVPDLTQHLDTWDLFGMEYKLVNDDFIPIRTYIDYGLDRVGTVEEEEKIDPLIPLLELLGSIGKGEQIWLQFIIRADMFSDWRKRAQAYIEKLIGKTGDDGEEAPIQIAKVSPGEREKIKAIERSLSKYGFEAVIRALYLAPKEYFKGESIGILGHFFKPFNSQYHNSIIPRVASAVVWKYQDLSGRKKVLLKQTFFQDYVTRESFYQHPKKRYHPLLKALRDRPSVIFTSEELATLFHLPGRATTTSAIQRIESLKAEPPRDLPVVEE